MSHFVYDSIETVMFVGFVFNNTGGSIGFFQAVGSLNSITIAFLYVLLLISSVRIMNCIVESIFGMSLKLNVILKGRVVLQGRTYIIIFMASSMPTSVANYTFVASAKSMIESTSVSTNDSSFHTSHNGDGCKSNLK